MVGLCNIPTFDQYMFKLPNFSLCLQKNVSTYVKQMCWVQVLGLVLDWMATSLDFTLISVLFVVAMIIHELIKLLSFVAFHVRPSVVLGHNLAKLEISLFVHFLVTKYRQHFTFSIIIAQTTKVFASCAMFEESHANSTFFIQRYMIIFWVLLCA